MSNGLFLLSLIAGTFCVLWYVVAPIQASLTRRFDVEMTAEPIDGTNYPVPEALRVRLDHDISQLVAAGFQPLDAFLIHGYGPTIELLNYCFANRRTLRMATISAVLVATPQNRSLKLVGTDIDCEYRDGNEIHELCVSNTSDVGPFFREQRQQLCLVPHVSDIPRILEIFDRSEQRDFADMPKFLEVDTEFAGNAANYFAVKLTARLTIMCNRGYFARVADEPKYRMPLTSVYILLWRQWWPMHLVYRQIIRSRGRRLERSLLRR